MQPRYAIYVTLPEGPLGDFAAAWLGWDAAAGMGLSHPELPGLPRPVAQITERPRKYGFHGTMKAPFRLAEGTTETSLRDAFAEFCGQAAPVDVAGLAVTRIGRFLALTPQGDTAALAACAAAVVERFEPFRAPLTLAEDARRRAAGLSVRQAELLRRWGYPYTHDEFRFHMTLTGPLPPAEAAQVQAVLGARIADLLPAPFRVDALTLLRSDADGRFHHLLRCPLTGRDRGAGAGAGAG